MNSACKYFDKGDKLMDSLTRTQTGKIKRCYLNALKILCTDPALKGKFRIEGNTHVIANNLPWRKCTIDTRLFKDSDEAHLLLYLERTYGFTYGAIKALKAVFRMSRYDEEKNTKP